MIRSVQFYEANAYFRGRSESVEADGGQAELGGHDLSEAELLDLAAGGHRELADDLEPLGELLPGDFLGLEIPDDLGQRERLARPGTPRFAYAWPLTRTR